MLSEYEILTALEKIHDLAQAAISGDGDWYECIDEIEYISNEIIERIEE